MTNIIKEDNKLTIQKIKECTCDEKNEDNYILLCTIKEKGTHFYSYKRGQDYITKDSVSKKTLFLSSEAKKTVNDTIDEFDKKIENFNNNSLDYLHLVGDCYLLLIRKNGKTRISFASNANELAHKVYCDYDNFDESKKTILQSAVDKKDHLLILKLKVYYKEASLEEIKELEKLIGRRVLPQLPSEFNKSYSVVASTINFKILEDSGYKLLHRPYFAMKDSTHNNFSLNPHTKTGVDAALTIEKSITFDDYLELFN